MTTQPLTNKTSLLKVEVITMRRSVAKQIRMIGAHMLTKAQDDAISSGSWKVLGWVARDAIESGSYTATLFETSDGLLFVFGLRNTCGDQLFLV